MQIREEMKAHEEELQAQYVAFQKEKQARKALAKKLKAMEEKLVRAGLAGRTRRSGSRLVSESYGILWNHIRWLCW